MTAVICLLSAAWAMWFLIFSPWTRQWVAFWPAMTTAACVLAIGAMWQERKKFAEMFSFRPGYIFTGVISAAILYGVFAAGNFFAVRILGFAADEIASVYSRGEGMPPVLIGLVLFFVIGPAEEIFWRGFVQRRLCERAGTATGYLLAVFFYGAAHIWSFNFMLIAAAVICGAFWGLMFARYRSLWPVIISHAVWDAAIFVIWPLD